MPGKISIGVALCTAILLAGCGGPMVIDAPPPKVGADLPDSIPPVPISTLEAPIVYDLEPILSTLEDAVPRKFGDMEKRTQHPTNGRVSFAFAGTRTPFRISIDGTNIRMASVVSYEAKGWFDPLIGPTVSGGCDGREDKPRLSLALRSTFSIDSLWHLKSRTRLTRAAPLSEEERDRCKVTFLDIDVTDRVVAGARGVLQKKLRSIDRHIAAIDVHTQVHKWWIAMSRPISLGDSLWLTLNPARVALDSVTSDSTAVVATISLIYNPRIITGPRPPDPQPELPPLLRGTPTGHAMHAALVGFARYPELSSELTKRLSGRKLSLAGRRITIQELTVKGIGGGRVGLALDFTGAAKGRVWLTGTPVYDTARRVLSVPDLDYDIGSAKVLVKGMELLIGFEARDILREQAQFEVDELLEKAREAAEKAMNRQLTEGVDLVATLTKGDALSVRADIRGIQVRFAARGRAGLVITREPRISAINHD